MLSYLKEKGIYGKHFFNVKRWWALLMELKIIHFLFVGGTGVLIQLLLTWSLTHFVFGLDKYYIGYSFGLGANLIYNFVMHTKVTFEVKDGHFKRLIIFVIYALSMTFFQYKIVRFIVSKVGDEWYLLVISSIILIFSTITFVLFKFWLFKDNKDL